jgi:seipin
MVLFMMELLFALICCRPVIIPRARLRDDTEVSVHLDCDDKRKV